MDIQINNLKMVYGRKTTSNADELGQKMNTHMMETDVLNIYIESPKVSLSFLSVEWLNKKNETVSGEASSEVFSEDPLWDCDNTNVTYET